jgi:hypothetical protein|tara:strand:+ start:302 stop:775 length:474 start_codon:yes stop_codon:yes gene_type:complete
LLKKEKEKKKMTYNNMEEKQVSVNVIATYENQEQEWFDTSITIKPINKTIDQQLSVEKKVLKSVIKCLEQNTDDLVKLSLAYTLDDLKSDEDVKENGFGFINRTNSKYYFQPDQRGEFIQMLCEELDIASKTSSYKDWAEKNNVQDIDVSKNFKTAI